MYIKSDPSNKSNLMSLNAIAASQTAAAKAMAKQASYSSSFSSGFGLGYNPYDPYRYSPFYL